MKAHHAVLVHPFDIVRAARSVLAAGAVDAGPMAQLEESPARPQEGTGRAARDKP